MTDPPRLTGQLSRPFWSVMIPVYNSTKYLERTLESVLSQDPGPSVMQIEVIDGHSTKNLPQALVQRIAGDRISVFRHDQPLSMAANWNSCIERARGEWVHILHSDDFVLPGFYSRLQISLEGRIDVGAAFTGWTTVDETDRVMEPAVKQAETADVLLHGLDRIASAQIIQFPSMVVRKSVYEEVGGFRSDLVYALDWEMWVRIAVRFPVWYEPESLACYRVHQQSETQRLRKSGADLADEAKTIPIIVEYLPRASRARPPLALRLLDIAKGLFLARRPGDGMQAIAAALRLDCSRRVIASALSLAGWTALGVIRVGRRRAGLIRCTPKSIR